VVTRINPVWVTYEQEFATMAVGGPADWLNVVTQYGADPTGAADSTAAIQGAINAASTSTAGGGVVYLPAGTYKVGSIAGASFVSLIGAGMDITTLKYTSTSVTGITGQSLIRFGLRDIGIFGPNSGTGLGINLTWDGSHPNYVSFINVQIQKFGSHGLQLQNAITSPLVNVISQNNGGRGFYLTGVPGGATSTSVSLTCCYANNNALDGYYLQSMSYSTLNSCASDTNATGYVIAGCISVTLSGCGAEAITAKNSLDGTSYKITQDSSAAGSKCVSLVGCRSYQNAAVAFWVTGNSQNSFLASLTEDGPLGGATASVKTDSGTLSTIAGVSAVTAVSLVSNTYNMLNDGAGNVTVAGNTTLGTTNVYGNVDVALAGQGLRVTEGSNAKQGTANLVGGSAAVSNTSVTANSRIFLESNVPGGTPGWLRVSARTPGTSFTITSSSGTDTSTVAYEIFEPG
jgi:pectate lyase-like protein